MFSLVSTGIQAQEETQADSSARIEKKILLTNGLLYQYESLTTDSNWISFTYFNKKRQLKTRSVLLDDIFSYTKGGKEKIVFGEMDDLGMVAIEEMRIFIEGEMVAREAFHSKNYFISGALVGLSSGILLNSVLVGLLVPPVYTMITNLCPVSDKRFPKHQFDDDVDFQKGRSTQYKRMRTGAVLKSTSAGIIVGLIAGAIIRPHK